MKHTHRLMLGSAQFGQSYGIARAGRAPDLQEVCRILKSAREAGINGVDTAQVYGQSEEWLGKCGISDWRVISKLPANIPVAQPGDIDRYVSESVLSSLTHLQIDTLDGLLLHRAHALLDSGGEKLYSVLRALKEKGFVRKIGISIYDPQELPPLMARFHLDIVQAPFNVLDRRMETSGWFDRLDEAGVEIHVRSIFLQGLLLMSQNQMPAIFDRWSELWTAWGRWLAESGKTPLQACLEFIASRQGIDQIIVGVDHVEHLRQILGAYREVPVNVPETLSSMDTDLINPSRWASL